MTPPDHPIPGVGAVVLDDAHRLLVVLRGRGARAGQWAVPGGKLRYGERMRDAVVREVAEETGLVVEPGPVAWVGETIGPGDPPAWHFTLIDLYATVVGGSLRAGDDAAEARWVPLDEVLTLPVTPTMHDLVATIRADLAAGRPLGTPIRQGSQGRQVSEGRQGARG